MKITPRRFSLEEFPEQQSWIGPLITALNTMIQELFSGFNNNITVADNLYQEIKEIKFTVDAGTYPIKFKTKFNKLPAGLTVIHCRDTAGGTASNTPWVNWSFNDGQITITNITNLTTTKTYICRILVIYG